MENIWPSIAACAGIVSLSPVLLRLRRGVHGTALESAWPCAALVWLFWLIIAGLTVADRVGEPSSLHAWIDVLWYLAAILALTPPVAVLGARRPTAQVWRAFVLIPLVLVFAWPVLPALRSSGGLVAFTLETPLLVGFALVLVMGAGNYIGLRFSPSAFLWIVGVLLIVLPLCPATAGRVLQAETGRGVGVLCLAAAAWLADRQEWKAARRERMARADRSIASGATFAISSALSGHEESRSGSTTRPESRDCRSGWGLTGWKTRREVRPQPSTISRSRLPKFRSAGFCKSLSIATGSIGGSCRRVGCAHRVWKLSSALVS